MSASAVCLIPARQGSKRVPGKNVRVLGGHPALAYTIAPALQSGIFDAVIVSTDSEEIAAIARLARTAEKHYGFAQDIEWAVDDDLPPGSDIVLLQARPETVWSKKRHTVSAKTDLVSSIVDTLVNPLYSRKGAQTA